MSKKLITTSDVLEAAQSGKSTLSTPADACIITPMARDEANRLGIDLDVGNCGASSADAQAACSHAPPSEKVISEVCKLIKARLPAGSASAKLENIVRDVVYAKMGEGADLNIKSSSSSSGSNMGVRFINQQRILKDGASPIQVDEKMLLAEAVGSDPNEMLAGGYMSWENASFTRKVEHPEIAVILEGELRLEVGGSTMVGKTGDMVYFSKGAVVVYTASDRVKLACVNCI